MMQWNRAVSMTLTKRDGERRVGEEIGAVREGVRAC